MATLEELSPIDEQMNSLLEEIEDLHNEYMNLQAREEDTSDLSERNNDKLYRIEEKIKKQKLRLMKRGIKI